VKRLLLATAAVAAALVVTAAATADSDKKDGFKTAAPPMLIGVAPGSTTEAIISVGDMVGGYRFESIPDGISLRRHDNNRVNAFVNHETSLVPFPFPTPPTPTTEANSQNDFENSQVSLLTLNAQTHGVIQGSLAIASAENYQRFCSNFMPTRAAGFNRPILLTNEEGIDWVKRTGKAWPTTIGAADSRQIGAVVAHDVLTGETRPIWGMGRHNHENSLAVQGYGHPVVLSGDDSFVNDPAQSQVYSYIADSANDVMNDRGDLYAFVSDNPAKDDYFDFAPGDPTSITGHFVKVPKDVATGRRPDGTDLMAADKGYPLPPSVGWQRDAVTTLPIDGPQWVLEHWGDIQPQPAFQFVRIEDMAYDKRPGMENVVYLVDSGRGTLPTVTPPAGLARSTNGRVWKMVLDKNDPTQVLSLSILIEGDDQPVKTPTEIHQPDNIESTPQGLLITEDPGSSQQFLPTDAGATTARIMRYTFETGLLDVAAKVDQSLDENLGSPGIPSDKDAAPAGRWGAWESSGIIDASAYFGPGAFLATVQAHSYWIEKQLSADDNFAPPGPDYTHKREGGQLVLLRIPGWGGNSSDD
jgi:uncharacterized protein DUF839